LLLVADGARGKGGETGGGRGAARGVAVVGGAQGGVGKPGQGVLRGFVEESQGVRGAEPPPGARPRFGVAAAPGVCHDQNRPHSGEREKKGKRKTQTPSKTRTTPGTTGRANPARISGGHREMRGGGEPG